MRAYKQNILIYDITLYYFLSKRFRNNIIQHFHAYLSHLNIIFKNQ